MTRWLSAAIVLLTAMILSIPAGAADYSLRRDRVVTQQTWIKAARPLPFPRGERAQAVWAEGGCWKMCQIDCTDGLDRGVEADGDQVAALAATNFCDRSCQQACRIAGGPLLPPIPQ
jgi:hypothetical protein